ncbi:MAG: DegT/DnrJ/EryC1/StrS family aminotransferase [Planctomycetes bacterium]|nr:DegT/DnrJ/EryC1/StrS family aminotransferase [Planctomycetota bacterium]
MPVTRVKVPLLDLHAQYAPLREELRAAVDEVFDKLAFIGGPYVETLEKEIAAYVGATDGIGVSSGTDALLVAMMALGIGPGDEVITSPYTFFATVGCVLRLGAKCVFVDIDPDTYNIDATGLEAAVTPRTKAILPVHLFGQCADMAAVNAVAARHGLPVIEDAAQAIGARDSDGRAAGCLGTVACFSFYPSKNLGAAGDGGMLTTSDGELAHTMRIMRNHGMEPAYHHGILGGNFRLDGIQGAVLSIKLRHLDAWAEGRRKNACEYHERFAERGLDTVLRLPVAREGVYHVFNQYVVRVPDGKRDALMAHLRKNDVGCAIYYPSGCHTQPCVADQGYHAGDFPETERAARETVSLPIFSELSDEQKETVVDVVAEFFGK